MGDDRLSEGTVASNILAAILQNGAVDSKHQKSGLLQLIEVSLEIPLLEGSPENKSLEKRSGKPDPASFTIRTQS
ncbi:hypothetical protein [Rhizobium sp. RCC_161_2]|uniref:hypothetical protein n=1 Tax=Rhizobium sp. RCC_161_2 TaxID=3239219 RepID=UPI0035262CA2